MGQPCDGDCGQAESRRKSKEYRNDKEWRELFDSYDFISQDGSGFNNINNGEQGDLNNNGTESEVKEK